MRMILAAAAVAIGLVAQASGLAQEQAQQAPKVRVAFEPDGRVTLVANKATVREILAEWTRQGGSIFVNSERLSGTPLTLEFDKQPEKDVLASLLRQAAGYVLGPRRAGTAGISHFEVVYILPTSNPSAASFTPQPVVQQPQMPMPTPGSPADEIPPVQPPGLLPGGVVPGAPGPQPQPAAGDPARPAGAAGVSGVAVPVVPVVPVTATPPVTGRGGGGGGGGGGSR